MPRKKHDHVRISVDVPRAIHTEIQPYLDGMRTELDVPRRTDAGLSNVLLALLDDYNSSPELRNKIHAQVKQSLMRRTDPTLAGWRAEQVAQS